MTKLKAIIDPNRNAYYKVSGKFGRTAEYCRLTTSHRPKQTQVDEYATLRRYDPQNPNAMTFEQDQANAFDQDLVDYINREDALETDLPSPFEVRVLKHQADTAALEAPKAKRLPSPQVVVPGVRKRSADDEVEPPVNIKCGFKRPRKDEAQRGRGGRGGKVDRGRGRDRGPRGGSASLG
jgi:hypothetical protein